MQKFLTVGTSPDGNKIKIPYFVFNENANTKKTFYIQGGMHGGEVTIWVVNKLMQHLQNYNKKFDSKIIIVPVANPISWQQRLYFYTGGKFSLYDGKDWNRNFPGDKNGTLGEKIAAAIFSLASKAQCVVDMHTSRKSFPFAILCESNVSYINKIGMEYNYVLPNDEKKFQKYKGTLLYACKDKNIDSVTYECGSHDSLDEENVEIVFQSLLRLLNLSNHKNSLQKQYNYSKLLTYRAQDGGFLVPFRKIGQKYKKGDLLFSVLKTDNLRPEKIFAKENGIVQKISPTHILWPGDDVYECIPEENIGIVSN